MSTPSSTRPPRRRSRRSRALSALAPVLLALAACSDSKPTQAQMAVLDAKNLAESALHTAHELESLTNEAKALANQAHELAASPYSHVVQTSQTLQDIAQLAQSVRGVSANVSQLETQFQGLYPTAVTGADPRQLLQQAQARATAAHDTAQDLAHVAAQLEQLSQGRDGRVTGALNAARGAQGPTGAVQAAAQLLGAMSEDLGSLRAVTLAQSRLMAEEAASRAADRTAASELHRRLWAHEATPPPNPSFDPYSPK